MELNKLNKIISICLWIAFIMIAFLSVHYKYDACNVCKLEYNKTKLDGSQFFNVYANKCLVKKPDLKINDYSNMNITFINP